jgi:RNA polymerase sigma factor (sigma-70 family)
MNPDPFTTDTDCISGPDQPDGPELSESSGPSGPHTERVAELFREEHQKLVHYLVSRTGSWAEARDIAAQAFAQVLEVREAHKVGFLKAYVYRAARNLATDRAKLGLIRTRIKQAMKHELMTSSPSPEPTLVREERLQALQQAVDGLRPKHRAMLIWRMYEDLSYVEIEARFAAQGILVNERTLNRWYAEALREVEEAVRAPEGLREERGK